MDASPEKSLAEQESDHAPDAAPIPAEPLRYAVPAAPSRDPAFKQRAVFYVAAMAVLGLALIEPVRHYYYLVAAYSRDPARTSGVDVALYTLVISSKIALIVGFIGALVRAPWASRLIRSAALVFLIGAIVELIGLIMAVWPELTLSLNGRLREYTEIAQACYPVVFAIACIAFHRREGLQRPLPLSRRMRQANIDRAQ